MATYIAVILTSYIGTGICSGLNARIEYGQPLPLPFYYHDEFLLINILCVIFYA